MVLKKSGCSACKSLRVKCDELRPACQRCAERGIKCPGYARQLKWITPEVEEQSLSGSSSRLSETVTEKRHVRNLSVALRPDTNTNSSALAAAVSRVAGFVNPRSNSIPKSLSQYSNFLGDSYETNLFEHWLSLMSNIIHLDGGASRGLLSQQIEICQEPQSLCLPMLLASAATHRFAMGIGDQEEPLRLKQRGILSLRRAIESQSSVSTVVPSMEAVTTPHMDMPHIAPIALSDQAVLASLSLVGTEVILGTSLAALMPLLQGSVNLVKLRQEYNRCRCPRQHPMRQDRLFAADSPILATTIDTLFYFDTITCVPCARRPVSSALHTYTNKMHDKNQKGSGIRGRPNPTLGFAAEILFMISQAASLVADFYAGSIDTQRFDQARTSLMHELTSSILALSASWANCSESSAHGPRQTTSAFPSPDSILLQNVENHNANVAAAQAHAYATQIFLLRSTDFEKESQEIIELVSQLALNIGKVTRDSAPMSIMLWPLWVLGCESYSERKAEIQVQVGFVENQQEAVAKLFTMMFERMHMLNIQVAFKALMKHIWCCNEHRGDQLHSSLTQAGSDKLSPAWSSTPGDNNPATGPSITKASGGPTPQSQQQSYWVRKCWLEDIGLILC